MIPVTEPRTVRLKTWMHANNITWKALGAQLGINGSSARMALQNETIAPKRHAQLIELGFPNDLLPLPCKIRRGPSVKTPHFPGLPRP